jgi:hypothetical protein
MGRAAITAEGCRLDGRLREPRRRFAALFRGSWLARGPAILYLICGWIVAAAGAAAAAEPQAKIEDFYGTYEGHTIASNDEGLTKRDLGLVIKPNSDGFSITWTTVTQGRSGDSKRKTYSIDFEATRKPNIYSSAMRKDMFGNRTPLDPLKGDPFVWATIRGKTLVVYSLLLTDEGGYELQTYERTLSNDGLHLEFSRIREGLHLKYITGTLVRTKS